MFENKIKILIIIKTRLSSFPFQSNLRDNYDVGGGGVAGEFSAADSVAFAGVFSYVDRTCVTGSTVVQLPWQYSRAGLSNLSTAEG